MIVFCEKVARSVMMILRVNERKADSHIGCDDFLGQIFKIDHAQI